MREPELTTLIKSLMTDAGMTETQIAAEVGVTQPTINRIKKGSGTSYEIGMGLRRLAQARIKSKRLALNS